MEHTKFGIPLLLIFLIIAVGTAGFVFIEDLSVIDAFYMTVITATTVGFSEIEHEFSVWGRLFTVGLIVTSITLGGYCISLVFAYVVEGRLGTVLRRKRMESKITGLKGHIILCGLGRTGSEVMDEFTRRRVPWVGIEQDAELVDEVIESEPKSLIITGNSTNEEVLERAGIHHARGVVFALTADTDNIVGVLTARSLNPDVLIVARGANEEALGKLARAGANHVILPAQLAGQRIAAFALSPSVVDFLDISIRGEGTRLILDDLFVGEESVLAGKLLRDSRIRERSNANVVAIRRDMEYQINPPVDTELKVGDILIILGTQEQLDKLFKYAGGNLGWGAG